MVRGRRSTYPHFGKIVNVGPFRSAVGKWLVRKFQQMSRARDEATTAFTVCFAVWMLFAVIGIPIKGSPRPQRNPVRPAGGHAGADRLADPAAARHADRQVRRPHRLLRADACRCCRSTSSVTPPNTGSSSSPASSSALPAAPSRSASPTARWFERQNQGGRHGVFGASNSGAAVTKFVAPRWW